MKVLRKAVGPIQANAYICWCAETREAVLIDPGDEPEALLETLRTRRLELVWIILTHFHYDHIGAAEAIKKETKAPILIHRNDGPSLATPPDYFQALFGIKLPRIWADNRLMDGDIIPFGECELQVIATPGHSPGGICLYDAVQGVVFTGDTLFQRGIGRTDFPGSDHAQLIRSISERLFSLPADTVVYPGHGGSTSIGDEKVSNPFI
ncbi:MAG: MBL fold metallo-hydrolase [Chloroflexi bacterium]|nr:MBL fold metallo-hydrolase [Chloroflexota bacterium]